MSDSHPVKTNQADEESKKPSITRRKFLSYAGVLGAAPLVGQLKNVQKKILPQAKIEIRPTGPMFNILRPDDLLCLDFEFINFKLADRPRPHLVKENRSQPGYMIVHFPPQSVAEEAFYETTPELNDSEAAETPRLPPVFSRISGLTRLSFVIPDEINEIPLTLESLLAWQLYQPSLVPVALPPDLPAKAVLRPAAVKTGTAAAPASSRSSAQVAGAAAQTYFQRNKIAQAQLAGALLRIIPPERHQTAIELPYRLILSPNIYNVWVHAVSPVSLNGWTELWHTRLAALNEDGSVSEEDNPYLTVRAVWSPDADLKNLTGPDPEHLSRPRLSLDPNDRHQLVHLTSNFNLAGTPKYRPLPVKVNRLMLSPLGAWLDSIGNWPPNSPLAKETMQIITWQHLATMGRDHYVKVVYAGYLLPFGHRASLVKITERKFYKTRDGQNVAYLFQKKYIMVRDPDRIFPAPLQPVKGGMEIPFTKVKLTTLVTPPIDQPGNTALIAGAGDEAFWPRVNNADFIFQAIGTDVEGHEVQFKMPMAFVAGRYAFEKADDSGKAYNSASLLRRQPDFLGQAISFAPENKKEDTSFEVKSISWKVSEDKPAYSKDEFLAKDQPMCFPAMEVANISVPALKNLVGFETTAVNYANAYIQNGFSPSQNKGEVFLQIVEDPLPLVDFAAGGQAEKSGGLATPSFSIVGLSRILGPVGGKITSPSASAEPQSEAVSGPRAEPDKKVIDEKDIKEALKDTVDGKFYPEKFFDDKAKILGGILLKDVVDKVEDFSRQDGDSQSAALKIKTEPVYESGSQLPAGLKTFLKWTPALHDFSIFMANRDGTKSSLTLNVEAVTYFNGKEGTYQVKGELTDFSLDLIKDVTTFILVKFSRFTFTAEKGKKTNVDPKIASIKFQGPLKFIEELLKRIPLPGSLSDSDGGSVSKPVIKVDASGAKLSYGLAIPDVAFGVFSMQNLKFSGEIALPFTGDPVSLRFAFNERNNPFLLTVAMFGGGGFFALVLSPDGIKLVEGSLEFGGSFAMNLGVASGGMTLMAGIYFKYEEQSISITGYVRCTGELDVLGLISISAEFYLSLTYQEQGNKVYGQASLTVKIKILFFSKKVTLQVEREFGASPPPLFCDLMAEDDWLAYCQAFAQGED